MYSLNSYFHAKLQKFFFVYDMFRSKNKEKQCLNAENYLQSLVYSKINRNFVLVILKTIFLP